MDEEYDVIVLGTGLKECILSGLLSVDGIKVLHMDRNDYYGGESTSLNLIQLWKRFRGDDKPPPHLGSSRDYNVDMIPKFMMANGSSMEVLSLTKERFTKVLEDMETLKSPLMGLFEKRRARKFFIYVQDYKESEPQTHEGMDLTRVTTRQLIAKYGLDDNTVDFIGHALALHRDNRYLDEPALDTAFARLSVVYGGTYMLNKHECKVEFDEEGKVFGVISKERGCKKVVCDPSYLLNKGKFIAFVSTEAETYHPEVELKQGIDLLGPVDEIFFDVYDRYEPVNEPSLDNCFISMSYDATT
ncbi:hypothetical protein IFM89_017118 [Coptis chinensis]|uniref:Guanosine nucleotide diphosphate dissociation inhibitor n=1 Tax=Coptis chinensis TaxID=261450 RepID=A0A835HKS5_9MAGN|nr:hypothetical protein IFM89_017118 [Coptis chinensis]